MSLPTHLTPAEQDALRELLERARATLGASVLEVRLFGSRARAEGNEHSDLDVAFIVSAEGRRRRHEVYDLAWEIGLRHGVDLAPVVIEQTRLDELRARERLFARDLDTEGIAL